MPADEIYRIIQHARENPTMGRKDIAEQISVKYHVTTEVAERRIDEVHKLESAGVFYTVES